MKFMQYGKDGGPESTVSGFWLVEIKPLFSIVLLKFEDGSRDAYHEHAFHCVNWLLSGKLLETFYDSNKVRVHRPSYFPFAVRKDDFHKVVSHGTSWVLSFRGPWRKQWKEYVVEDKQLRTLEDGRKVVHTQDAPKP